MKRSILVYATLAAATAALGAQQTSKPAPYAGISNPPPDTSIVTNEPAQDNSGKPPAGVTGYEQPVPIPPPAEPAETQPAAPAQPQPAAQPYTQPSPANSTQSYAAPASGDGTDDGIVQVAPDNIGISAQPALNERGAMSDPDGDIVHPAPLPAGTLGEGATIRVRLLDRLSTAESEDGEHFHTRVASDVIQDGQVLIPAGAEIDGTVVGVSSGHPGGHGSMHLRPQTVIMPDGSRFQLYALVSGAPGARIRVGDEGAITPDSRLKKDGIEYGAAVGGGAVTGAILGGPGGAIAGSIVGAGVITAHLLVSHPQATLEAGTVLLFTLSEPLNLVPAKPAGE